MKRFFKALLLLIPLILSVVLTIFKAIHDPFIMNAIHNAMYTVVFIASILVFICILSLIIVCTYSALLTALGVKSLSIINKKSSNEEN